MFSERPKTQRVAFGLLISFGLIDGLLRTGIFPINALTCNAGIALGILLPKFLLWLGIGIFLSVAWYQAFSHPRVQERLAWTSMAVGGFINGLDRLWHGCVTDYLRLPFFPSFNLADIMLFLGVAFLILTTLGIAPKTKPYVS